MKCIKGKEKGFTLIELVVALLIAALVVAGATAAIVQVLNATHNSSHMVAVRQVQTAGGWVSRDGLQAQNVTFGASNGFPLNLTWTDWDDSQMHQVGYSLVNMTSGDLKNLQRQENITGLSLTTTIVAQYINASATRCGWITVNRNFAFNVTAKVDQETEFRTYEIQPRALI